VEEAQCDGGFAGGSLFQQRPEVGLVTPTN
jgi:hypothetical protein